MITPPRNGLELLSHSLETLIHRTDYSDYEILVVDNDNDDPTVLGYLEGLEAGRPNPCAAGQTPPSNSPHSTMPMTWKSPTADGYGNWSAMPSIRESCVWASLWSPDEPLQHGGCVLEIGGVAGRLFKDAPRGAVRGFGRNALIQNYSTVTAASPCESGSSKKPAGSTRHGWPSLAYDIDFCLNARDLGYRNLWIPYAKFYHHESASRRYEDTPEKQQHFAGEINAMLKRWGDLLATANSYRPSSASPRNHSPPATNSYGWRIAFFSMCTAASTTHLREQTPSTVQATPSNP